VETDLAEVMRHALAGDAFSIRKYAQEHGLNYQQAAAEIARLLDEGEIRELIRLGSTERSARYVWV